MEGCNDENGSVSIILILSIMLRLIAFAWSISLMRQLKDWRILFLSGMFALMALRQILALTFESETWVIEWYDVKELPGLAVSLLAFFALYYLKNIIVEHQQAVTEQHKSENRFHNLVEQSPLSTQLMRTDGTIIQVNKAWEKLWGIKLDALNGYNILQDQQLKDKGIMPYIERGFAGEALSIPVFNFNPEETPNVEAPASHKLVRAHIYPLRNTSDEIYQVVLFHEDVTEGYLQNLFQVGQSKILKQIADPDIPLADVLTELVLFIEELSPNMLGSILLLDESGNHLLDAAGPSLATSYRDTIDGLEIGPDVGSCGTAAYTGKRVIVSNIATDPLWANFKDLASEYGLCACWSQPIYDSAGKVLGTFAMYYQKPIKPQALDIRLITDAAQLAAHAILHKQSMQEIIKSQAMLVEAQRLSKIGNWELDLVNDKLLWSDEIYRIFEIDKDTFDASYEAFLNAIHPDDRDKVNQAYTESLENKLPYEITHRLLMPDGRIKHVTERCETTFNNDGKPLRSSGTVQDITKLVEAQNEKEVTISKMEHVQRLESLGVLAGGIAHDFNNILTAIMGNAGLASSKLPQTSQVHGYIERITQASQKATDLCKQMLAYSGKGKFIIKPILLSEIVEDMSQLLQVTIAKNIVLRLNLSKQIPAIDADITQMQQIIMNLVINASEAIGKNSGAISVSTGVMRVDAQYLSSTFVDENLKEGQYVYLEVSDTGCGMSPEVQSKIFEPFFTTKFTGRGLGMAAILGIVRGHGGAIKAYSEEGKGSSFKVLFPCSKHAPISLKSHHEPKPHWHGHGCVLVVDDEETIREVASSMLKDMGLKPLTAADGVEGIDIFRQHHQDISVVLLDMTMPRMGGEDAFTELCRIDPNVKVILSSGYNEQDATNRFAGKGLAGFLQKPYTPQQLSEKLANIFDKT